MISLNKMLFSNVSKRFNLNILKRYKHKESIKTRKKSHSERALDHFDDFYGSVFKKDWVGIREGLLSKQRYVALVNNYSDSNQICDELERSGAMNLRTLFNLEKEFLKEKRWRFNKRTRKMLNNSDNGSAENDEVISDKIDFFEMNRSMNENNNLNEFIPATKIKGMEDFITESEHYRYYNQSEKPIVEIEKQYDFHFPQNLNIYVYDSADKDLTFRSPSKGSTGVYNYYLLDGGSLLPILALDIQFEDKILDMCCAPGGKALLALQTLYPRTIVCNDVSKSRVDRIRNVMNQYLYDLNEKWFQTNRLRIQQQNGTNISEEFDRILVDVPCTTDRHSVHHDDNNIFKPDRVKERLKLPEIQSELLTRALRLIKKNGIVVYSTCTLSPIQNDGVVHMALKRIGEETNLKFKIIDLNPALVQVLSTYKVMDARSLKYGHLVLPNVDKNFGPTYFCKIQRI